jgi:hypothetical protein
MTISGHSLYNIFNLFCNKVSHYGEPAYDFLFTLYKGWKLMIFMTCMGTVPSCSVETVF